MAHTSSKRLEKKIFFICILIRVLSQENAIENASSSKWALVVVCNYLIRFRRFLLSTQCYRGIENQ